MLESSEIKLKFLTQIFDSIQLLKSRKAWALMFMVLTPIHFLFGIHLNSGTFEFLLLHTQRSAQYISIQFYANYNNNSLKGNTITSLTRY